MDRMMALDAEQLKVMISEFHAAKDLKSELRQGLIGLAASTLANDHPQAFLALLAESKDLFEEYDNSTYFVSSSLTQWAKNDPLAAIEWVKKNAAKFPNLVTDDAKCGLISEVAIKDPILALNLIGELGMSNASQLISKMIGIVKTPQERTETFAALRKHLTTITDVKAKNTFFRSVMNHLADRLGQEGFDASSRWIGETNFTPAELEFFADGLNGSIKSDETGKWIDWIGKKLPADKVGSPTGNLVDDWTRKDYQAVGKWLATAAAGPTKNSAIRSYAETVSQYEPAVAAQWAMTLPAGEDRDQALKRIYRNWPENDPAAKQAFKLEHGIK